MRRARNLAAPLLLMTTILAVGGLVGAGSAVGRSSPTGTGRGGWKAVRFDGVHVDVPASWPVVDGMHTELCGTPFPKTATAFVGVQGDGGVSCPAPLPRSGPPARDGVWLQPGSRPVPSTRRRLGDGQVVFMSTPSTVDNIMTLWDHGVSIEIGVGPHPDIAHRILDSVGYAPGTRNTPVAEACARAADAGVMPTPERLSTRRVLERGDITLDPPDASDRAAVGASQVWKEAGPKQSFERYQLLLARYSSKFPARVGPNGTLIPTFEKDLAWVIYSQPRTPTIAGCGLWGVAVFDPATGHSLGSEGYAPGP